MTPPAADVAGALDVLTVAVESVQNENGRIHSRDAVALLRAALDSKDTEIGRLRAEQGHDWQAAAEQHCRDAMYYRKQVDDVRALLGDRERMAALIDTAGLRAAACLCAVRAIPCGACKTAWDTLAAALIAALDGTEGA